MIKKKVVKKKPLPKKPLLEKAERKLNPDHFRVAIFGSARLTEDDPTFKTVYALAKQIAKAEIDVVTGGGPGLMEAASLGHNAGDPDNTVDSIGLAIRLPHEQRDALCLDIKREFERFSGRLDTFMELSDVVVVAPGGVGTLLEFFYAWQLTQVKMTCSIPIILLGSMYDGLLTWLKQFPLRRKLISKTDFDNIFVAKTPAEAMKIIKRVHEDAKKPGNTCRNFEKYRRAIKK